MKNCTKRRFLNTQTYLNTLNNSTEHGICATNKQNNNCQCVQYVYKTKSGKLVVKIDERGTFLEFNLCGKQHR